MTFTNGDDFLSAIKEYGSFYNEEQELYVFHYNDEDAIAVYRISKSYAEKLRSQSRMMDCPWEALLGFGGSIYDSSNSGYYNVDNASNEDWCGYCFGIGNWETVYVY